jgi:hypothetical protein
MYVAVLLIGESTTDRLLQVSSMATTTVEDTFTTPMRWVRCTGTYAAPGKAVRLE